MATPPRKELARLLERYWSATTKTETFDSRGRSGPDSPGTCSGLSTRISSPYAKNLPERTAGRWGQGLTAAKMRTFAWLKPELVCQVGFTEWTDGAHLRHPTFKGMRQDKAANEVIREA